MTGQFRNNSETREKFLKRSKKSISISLPAPPPHLSKDHQGNQNCMLFVMNLFYIWKFGKGFFLFKGKNIIKLISTNLCSFQSDMLLQGKRFQSIREKEKIVLFFVCAGFRVNIEGPPCGIWDLSHHILMQPGINKAIKFSWQCNLISSTMLFISWFVFWK